MFIPVNRLGYVNIPNQDPFKGLKTVCIFFSGLLMMLAVEIIVMNLVESIFGLAFTVPAVYLVIHALVFMSMTHASKLDSIRNSCSLTVFCVIYGLLLVYLVFLILMVMFMVVGRDAFPFFIYGLLVCAVVVT